MTVIAQNVLPLRAVSFIGGGNRRKPPTCHKSLKNLYHIMLYRVHFGMSQAGFELTIITVVATDCTSSGNNIC
jgi:hypothetical protein